MYDLQNREIDYLRISLTDRCNLRCVYCMPEEGVEPVRHEEILTYEELERVCRCAAGLGIRKLKLTGGEPLVRKGVPGLVRRLRALPGIDEVTLTTNGILLGELAGELADAGLAAVNVSLDTLDPAAYRRITRRGELGRALAGLDAALAAGLRVKVNCVPAREFGEGQVVEIASLARERPIDVRFIELMPIGLGGTFTGLPADEVRALLEAAYGSLVPWGERRGNGPAEYWSAQGFAGKFGFVSAVSHRFCSRCNRVRLTATGFLKLCLQYDRGVDLRSALRGGADDEALAGLIARAVREKPLGHRFGEATPRHGERHTMAQIGG